MPWQHHSQLVLVAMMDNHSPNAPPQQPTWMTMVALDQTPDGTS